MTELLYIGPGLGAGTLILVLIIGGIVLFSLGYIIWFRVKRFFNRKNKTSESDKT
jgi:TM2 domain-containing membrane protein YozV